MTLTADWTSIPELVCTFAQKGNVLSGGCREAAAKSDANVVDVVDGRIDAEMVSWQMEGATPDGEPFTYSLSGTVDAKETVMKGSFKASNRTNVPLINVITNAYAMPPFRIVRVPEWVQRERFDITAKPPDDPSPKQLAMLRTLLEKRLKLRVHRESGERPAYDLLIASTDGRLGPRLKRAATDCSAATFTVPSGDSPCAGGFMGVGPAGGIIVTNGQPLARMTSALSMAVSRSVVDRTGLDGPFDAELRWSSDVNTTPRTATLRQSSRRCGSNLD